MSKFPARIDQSNYKNSHDVVQSICTCLLMGIGQFGFLRRLADRAAGGLTVSSRSMDPREPVLLRVQRSASLRQGAERESRKKEGNGQRRAPDHSISASLHASRPTHLLQPSRPTCVIFLALSTSVSSSPPSPSPLPPSPPPFLSSTHFPTPAPILLQPNPTLGSSVSGQQPQSALRFVGGISISGQRPQDTLVVLGSVSPRGLSLALASALEKNEKIGPGRSACYCVLLFPAPSLPPSFPPSLLAPSAVIRARLGSGQQPHQTFGLFGNCGQRSAAIILALVCFGQRCRWSATTINSMVCLGILVIAQRPQRMLACVGKFVPSGSGLGFGASPRKEFKDRARALRMLLLLVVSRLLLQGQAVVSNHH